jgi:hypothetical protein
MNTLLEIGDLDMVHHFHKEIVPLKKRHQKLKIALTAFIILGISIFTINKFRKISLPKKYLRQKQENNE